MQEHDPKNLTHPSPRVPFLFGVLQIQAKIRCITDHWGMIEKTPLNRAVRATKDIPAYLLLCGWGDGWDMLHVGAQIYLTEESDGVVHFLAGPNAPNSSASVREGGFFHVADLDSLENLNL